MGETLPSVKWSADDRRLATSLAGSINEALKFFMAARERAKAAREGGPLASAHGQDLRPRQRVSCVLRLLDMA